MLKILFISLLFFSSLLSKEICIKNFKKNICGNFQLLDSVIIKSKLSKKVLSTKLNKPLKQIAFLKTSNLYLVDSNESLKYSKELASKNFIIYAQPNLEQKRINTTFKTQDIANKYHLTNIWKTTQGEGVNIAIIDDGFDLRHEDLQGVKLLFAFDVDKKIFDVNPKSKLDIHGTQVAGIIFAQHNGIGIDGIAPKANLIALRQTTNITSDTILAFTIAKKAGADIINCSWNSPVLLEPVYDVIKSIAKDTIVVFAAGNKDRKITPYSIEAGIPEVVTVGATQKYSNYGKVVDFQIPSGVMTTKSNGGYGIFGGTSATAPIISGLLALKLSQNKSTIVDKNKLVLDLKKEIDRDKVNKQEER